MTRLLSGISRRAVVYAGLTAMAVLFLFPFFWLLTAAFKTQAQIYATPPVWLPNPRHIQNFAQLYDETNILRAFFNSVVIAVGHVALALFLCSLAGFAFAKYPRAPGNSRLFAFVLGTMMIPGAVTLIPVFLVMIKLHIINTYWAMIIPGAASAFGIFWMRQYMGSNVPDDLVHAARIDGCTEFGIYSRIAVPIARPALAALGIMVLIGTWNNLMWAFVVLRTKEMYTLPVLIYLLQGEQRTPWGMLMAGGLVTTLPLVLAFLFFQRQFIAGITSGAIKA
jgi:ABC-type glycerol-3-phosphate transport system permease component